MTPDAEALRRSRLHAHRITQPEFEQPVQAVAWLGAVQAQDYAQARWAVGLRCRAIREAVVAQAVNQAAVVRTWAMRGTLHLIAAADVRWIVAVVGPAALARAMSTHRRAGLGEAVLEASTEAIVIILEGGRQLTRKELFSALAERGFSTEGLRGSFMLYRAALMGQLCLGAMRGKQETYTLLEDWVPKARRLARAEALGELARRYFTSHGPATLVDFARWSGLPAGETRAALEAAEPGLIQGALDGQTYWMAEETPGPAPLARLLPGYDEYLIGYADRGLILDETRMAEVITVNGIFRPTLLINGRVAGLWTRAIAKGALTITFNSFAPLKRAHRQALEEAAEQYGAFVGLPATVTR